MYELTEDMRLYLSSVGMCNTVDETPKNSNKEKKIKKSKRERKHDLKACYMDICYARFINSMETKGLAIAISKVELEEGKAIRKYISKRFKEEYKINIDFFK